MLDYGFIFMNTKIYIDNESTICIVKNPVFHSKTKHIAIRHHLIRDAYEKKLIQVLKIHTDDNVADLLTNAFDVSSLYEVFSVQKNLDHSDEFHGAIWLAGKPVSISEASIRSDLLFNDADGIDSLPNQAIFDAIQLMGYEGDLTVLAFNKALFSPQWRFLFHTMNHYISSKSTSWDQIPTNIPTAVICLTTNQKYNFSKLIFDGMMRHLDAKKKFVMYPRFISVFLDKQLKNVPVPLDHFPINALTSKVFSFMVKKGKHFSGKVTPLFPNMLVQPTEDEGEGSERPSEPQPIPSPPHPSTDQHETQTNPSPRPSPTSHITDSIPEGSGGNHGGQSSSDKSLSGNEGGMTLQSVKEILEEIVDAKGVYMGKTRYVVHEEKENAEKEVSTKDALNTDQPKVSTDKPDEGTNKEEVSTDRPDEGTDKQEVSTDKEEVSTDRPDEGTIDQTEGRNDPQTPPTTTTPFGDDETIAQPLPKIDPKDKGKKKIEEEDESDTESEGIPEAEKKFKQLARDEEMARKVQEDWEAEEEVKKLAKEEAIKAALSNEYDFIQARIEADRLLALRLQDEERESSSLNRPPTRTQLRNQMMTYLKHVGNKKHSDLKNKTFEEIQVLYEKVKRFDESFTAVGSTEDERKIKEMNEGAKDPEQKRLKKRVVEETPKKDDTTKVPAKQDVAEQGTKKRKGGHIKMIARKKPRQQSDVDSDDEHRKCLRVVALDSTIDIEVMETKSVIARLNKVSSPDGDYLVIYRANGNFRAFNCLLEVLHIFDRQDLFHLYDLVMEQYSEITLEGIELILWGDLKIMMESSTEENDQSDFWNDQQDWEIVTWRLYEACGVYILELKDGTVIHMLVERRYPLSKDLLQRMLDLGLEVERESTAALDLIRFIKQQIDEK
ncbi:hypothetical protein Tco_0309803 [Tanacetum coccineum]